ncbi:MAG: carbohydrate ABC transporter permease [Anaerolineae bacterium]|nr:carbohydrate ABC transporter permease [Anaerolineae bacterium]
MSFTKLQGANSPVKRFPVSLSNPFKLLRHLHWKRFFRRLFRNTLMSLWMYPIALFFAVIFGYPLVWMVYSSFKPTRELVKNVWALPTNISFDNYDELIHNETFLNYYQNNLIVVLVSVPLLTLIAAMAAFVFARIRFKGSTLLFYMFLAGTMIPVHVTLIPLYTMLRDLHWLNTLTALIVPFISFNLPVSIFILRDFFSKIPTELEDAARVDGCSSARIFWSIMLPLARPAIATVVILSAVSAWNEYLFALTFIGANNDAYTLPLGTLSMVSALGITHFDRMFSVLTMATLPILAFYFIAQREIIKGITAGAIKG